MEDQINNHLPLTEATFFVLLSLAPSAKHGYAIIKDIQHLSAGRIHLSTGTLYGILDRLLNLAWIERLDTLEDQTGQRLRKSYQLSDLGQSILKAETNRMMSLVSIARTQTEGE